MRGIGRVLVWLTVAALAGASGVKASASDALFWGQGDYFFGSGEILWTSLPRYGLAKTWMSHPSAVSVLALDTEHDHMYWTGPDSIYRANLDGTDIEAVAGSFSFSEGLALDIANRQIYWTSWGGEIRRINFDGTEEVQLRAEGERLYGLALDLANDKMYWAAGDRGIYRANLDGTDKRLLAAGGGEPLGVAVDPAGRMVYWTDYQEGSLKRIDVDGLGPVEEIYSGPGNRPIGIALDLVANKVYWTDWGTGWIRRAELDGSAVEPLFRAPGRAWGLALGPEPPRVPPDVRENPHFTIEPVVVSGLLVSDSRVEEVVTRLGIPALNEAGEVAFVALDNFSSSLWKSHATRSLRLVARTGDPLAGLSVGVELRYFQESPLLFNEAGEMALFGKLTQRVGGPRLHSDEVILGVDAAGAVRVLAREGDTAPDTTLGSLFATFLYADLHLNDSGQVAFSAGLSNAPGSSDVTTDNAGGIWTVSNGAAAQLALRAGDAAVGGPSGSVFRYLKRPFLTDLGQLTFSGGIRVGPGGVTAADDVGVWGVGASGALDLIAREGNPAPGASPGTIFKQFGTHSSNGLGQIAFVTTADGDGNSLTGIWGPDSDGNLALLVQRNGPAPGVEGGVFDSFYYDIVLNEAGDLLFRATLSGYRYGEQGLWRRRADGQISLLALFGEQAPDLPDGVVFDDIETPGFNEAGEVVFVSGLRSGDATEAIDTAIFFADAAGQVSLVARSGDGLEVAPDDVRGVYYLSLDPGVVSGDLTTGGFNERGQVAFRAVFFDDSAAIFLASPVPEPVVCMPSHFGDLNGDYIVNILDISLVASCMSDPSGSDACRLADVNCDGAIDGADLDYVASRHGQSACGIGWELVVAVPLLALARRRRVNR